MLTPSALNAVTIALMLVIIGFFWRTTAAKLADRPIGQAMAFIY